MLPVTECVVLHKMFLHNIHITFIYHQYVFTFKLNSHYIRKQRLMNMHYKQLVKVQSSHTHVTDFYVLFFASYGVAKHLIAVCYLLITNFNIC